MQLPAKLNGTRTFDFEVDTGAGDNFLGSNTWRDLGQPHLTESHRQFESARQHKLPVKGCVKLNSQVTQHNFPSSQTKALDFQVTELTNLNLLGRNGIQELGISLDALLNRSNSSATISVNTVFDDLKADRELQKECRQLCDKFPYLFKPELGRLKSIELEIKFKSEAEPVYRKPRSVPLALQEDIVKAYEAGIRKGVWRKAQFNGYETAVVPIRKNTSPNQGKAQLRVCRDYAITVSPQLETHRHPLPSPEQLMQRLSGGWYFTKIDLADAYNEIRLGPEYQIRLALSTHRDVLLQLRLPFGISPALAYFQGIMDQLTRDLTGVSVYLDDILVSGYLLQDHIRNMRSLLKRVNDNGLKCRLKKCSFSHSYVEYSGHLLSQRGIAKGHNADGVKDMPASTNVQKLRSFLGSVQFYNIFRPNLSTTLEPLHQLIKKGTTWRWGTKEQAASDRTKNTLTADTVLVDFNLDLPLGISCDASEVEIGAVLFHRYTDNSERPIANV